MAVKKKAHEKLDDANIEKVIALREQEKPITIKEACERLNISPNGARLNKVIDEYKEQKALDEKRRAANRGKPATNHEIQAAIEWYLDGDSVADIAKRLYRSSSFVKKIIEDVGVPQRVVGENYTNYGALPEQCIAERFEPGERVWSAKYSAPCEIIREVGKSVDNESLVYHIYVFQKFEQPEEVYTSYGKAGFYANQCAYELGKLDHLRKHGVDIMRTIK